MQLFNINIIFNIQPHHNYHSMSVCTSSHPIFLHRRLEGATASSGDQVEGVCDGGGGEGKESHDLCAPAGGSLQHSAGFLRSTEAWCGLQSGSRWPHWDDKLLLLLVFLRLQSILHLLGLCKKKKKQPYVYTVCSKILLSMSKKYMDIFIFSLLNNKSLLSNCLSFVVLSAMNFFPMHY